MHESDPTEPMVMRTWKRDGTTNRMGLDAAVESLARMQDFREVDLDDRRQSIRRELLGGRTLETAQAKFVIPGMAAAARAFR